MSTAKFWSNVGVDIQTAISASQAITGATKASPCVITYSGADTFANGDYVYVTANGMTEINDRIFRVANVNTGSNTLELEGEDSTLFGTFVSGTIALITFGASFDVLQTINVSGGEPEFADTTTIHDAIRKRAPVVVSPLSFAFDGIHDLADPGFVEANKAYKAKAKRAVKFRFGTANKMAFMAYCAASGAPTGQAQGIVQTKVSFEAQNFPSFWTT